MTSGLTSGPDRPNAQEKVGSATKWIAVVVAAILALGMAYSVITLRRQADDLRGVEVVAARVAHESSELNALAWEAIASPGDLDHIAQQIEAASEQRQRDMGLVQSGEAGGDGVSRLQTAVDDHRAVLDELMTLFAAEQTDDARRLAQTRLAQSNDELHDVAEGVQRRFQDLAGRAYNTADMESVVMMLLGAGLAGLLFRKFDSAKRAGELKAACERAQSEARFRSLVQNSSDVITVIDGNTTIRYQSPSVERVLGYSPDQLVGTELGDLIHPDDATRVSDFHDDFMLRPHATSARIEYRLRHADGTYKHVDNVRTNLLADPDVRGLVINSRDITDNKKSADALRESEERLRFLVEHVPSVVYTAETGPDGRWLYVSPQIHALLGFTANEWMSDPERWWKQLHPDDRAAVVDDEEALLLGSGDRSVAIEYRMMTRDGRTIWINDDATIVRDERGAPLYWSGVLSDITDRKVLELQLQHQAFHDSLTGLANRALFTDRVEHALQRAQRGAEQVAVLFLDLDDFKTINDSLGHDAGDELLVTVARRLRRCLRPADTVARLGGDEFAVLLEGENVDSASTIAERTVKAIEEPLQLGDREVTMHVSAGIELGDSQRHSAGDLLRNADVAMYVAKGKGKARFEIFDSSMHAAALERLEIRADLQRALIDREFVVHYQPIVGLQESRIVGMEALVRWRHPQRGLVAPLEFIPVAEETGLIVPIGRWVLEEAAKQAKRWQAESQHGEDLTMSVNVSARQLMRAEIVDEVAAVLRHTGIPPQTLILEITESVLMNDRSAAISRLHQLRELGVCVAVDDFGTGYSSLGYLSSLPIDILKIDKSFIDRVAAGSEDSAIAKAVIKLGNSLSLTVVAEGIEAADQATTLRAMHCHRGQGFYFSEPLDATGVDDLLLSVAADAVPVSTKVAGA
ncbi:MAG: putative bifunctional diguanylate cyclase/phosphodiesterase [Actinomycetota bacterium]